MTISSLDPRSSILDRSESQSLGSIGARSSEWSLSSGDKNGLPFLGVLDDREELLFRLYDLFQSLERLSGNELATREREDLEFWRKWRERSCVFPRELYCEIS
jgi:hypothetical protein